MPSTTNGTSSLTTALDRDGYVLIPSVLTSDVLTQLRAACQRSIDLARSGQWPFIRTLPKQFPPWPADISHGIWGVQHFLHPSMPDHALFASSYFAHTVVDPVTELLGVVPDELVMELYNLLIRPDADFALRWHRDDIPPTATAEEEMARLGRKAWHAQWNLALFDDCSLIVVPGSHKRARTAEERAADPWDDNMPGQEIVRMQAGDVVFYNNNILHRGVYSKDRERMTLHGSMGVVGHGKERARNVLQHGVEEWVQECDFSGLGEGIRERAEGMRQRLVEMGRGNRDVGFAQED
ncbi:hypothetical protein BJ546DRAFT_858353 [Cryomyces antarcticus]